MKKNESKDMGSKIMGQPHRQFGLPPTNIFITGAGCPSRAGLMLIGAIELTRKENDLQSYRVGAESHERLLLRRRRLRLRFWRAGEC